ncbi:MAG TPA: hypothetical protein VE441_05840 [Mycobacterium sp.]|nr:hypothetical protein [Mycobacterium sp.]
MAATILAGGLTAGAVSEPATKAASPRVQDSSATLGRCPTNALPLTAESVARAADQARIEAPALYKGFGPAVVELAWRAKFRLTVWASTRFNCSDKARRRSVVVDLLFPQMLPSASLSEGVVLVSRFPTGYRVWEVGH